MIWSYGMDLGRWGIEATIFFRMSTAWLHFGPFYVEVSW